MSDTVEEGTTQAIPTTERVLPPTPVEMSKAYGNLVNAYAEQNEVSRQRLLSQAASTYARFYGAIPAAGINPEPAVEKGEVAFIKNPAIEMRPPLKPVETTEDVVLYPWGNTTFIMSEIISPAGNYAGDNEKKPVKADITIARESVKDNIGIAVNRYSTALTENGPEEPDLLHVVIYQSGQETHSLIIKKSEVLTSSEYELASTKKGDDVIPTEVRRNWRKTIEERLGPEQIQTGVPIEEIMNRKNSLAGKFVNVEALMDTLRTCDENGKIRESNLRKELSAVLGTDLPTAK
jgi:hypothetical protein